jgi:two-component system, cell cycle sensor histidine kinase and response regulator CckA
MMKKNTIQETELRYRTLFKLSPDGALLIDTEGNILEFNDAAHLQLGYTKNEFKKLRLCDIDAVETPEDIQARISFLLKKGKGEFEVKHRAKNGAIRDVQIIAQKLVFSGQTVFHAIWRDITERKKAEEALRESREFIKNILDTVDEGFIVIDRDYRIISANKAYCNQVNMSLGKIIGRHCHEISHRSATPCYEFGEECAVRDSFEKDEPFVYSHKHYDTDGNVIYVETKSYPLKDVSGNVTSVIEMVNNITDRHLLEEQLLRTQKLEAVGLLAGGLAHDFNNLLQGVFGSISLAKMFSDSGGKAYQMLEGAEIALNQARNLTRQLLTFSKGGEPVKKVISLSPVIQDSVKFSLSGSNVNYQFAMDENLWPVDADEGQISQVIHNIVLNAGDAMPEGGTVRIKASNVLVDRKNILPLKKGKYVLLAIEDSGVGIPANYLSKIFDPYFTTKKKGNGLGLATTFSIIKKHGGIIDVKSEPGKGSTFLIYLPASDTKLPSKKEEGESVVPGKGRILVMDDEEIVTLVVGQMLKSLGYESDFAENGEEAVEKYAAAMKSGEAFDTVILDLTVRGGMGGRETINRLREIDPAVSAIVSSGYSDDPVVANYRDYGFKDILSKPYEIGRLSTVLHALLTPDSMP